MKLWNLLSVATQAAVQQLSKLYFKELSKEIFLKGIGQLDTAIADVEW